jgi:hypothetical protein
MNWRPSMTHYVANVNTVYVDCDDTLVLWRKTAEAGPEVAGLPIQCWRHERHLTLLDNLKAVGYAVVVWSHGGAAWARQVVEALGIEDVVDVVVAKPALWLDDYPDPSKILEPTRHRYIGTPPGLGGPRDIKTTDPALQSLPPDAYR